MHKLLERQLKKLYGSLAHVPAELAALLHMVDDAYQQADADRRLLERSLDLTSQELLEANAELRQDRQELEDRVEERTAELLDLNVSLEREVTERRSAEHALRKSEQRYQTLAENSPAGILQCDESGRGLYANRKLCQMTGTDARSVSGAGWLDSVHPEDRRRVEESWRRTVSKRDPVYSTEFRFKHRDGSIFWVVAQAVALHDDDGQLAGYVLTLTDISERIAAEQALRESEAKFRDLFESSKDVIYISTPEGRLLDINPAGVQLLAYDSKEELLEADLGRDVYMRPRDRVSFLRRLEQTEFVKDVELAIRRKDGRVLTVQATTTAVRDNDGKIISMRGILRDVTGQRELERQLQQAQKLEAVGRLAGGVAHDFNNLLTAIIGYADLLNDALPEDNPTRAQVLEIRKAGMRGAELTQQLLAFSRRQVLKPQLLSLNRVVLDMERLLRRVIGEDVELETRLDPELGAVRADPTQIQQVILNLAINSRDAMPKGGTLVLETSNLLMGSGGGQDPVELRPGPYVRLLVVDSGEGIDDEIRDQIFEPFFTTKESGRGTGLGLSTVYGIVKQSGGAIRVRSARDQGTAFEIFLPQIAETPERAVSQTPERREPERGRETILLVEDEKSVRHFIAHFLEQRGYSVLRARDGRQALKVASSHSGAIDLLLSDIVMRGINGIELARRMTRTDPELKVLLMSGYTEKRTELEDPAAPGFRPDFLQKPFSTAELGRKLRELLDQELAEADGLRSARSG